MTKKSDNTQNNTGQKSERGQSLVELGISLVVLILLVSGIVDLGRAFLVKVSLNDAVQEGAAYGSVCPTHTTEIKERLLETATDPLLLAELDAADVTVCITLPGSGTCGASALQGNEIQVSVVYPHRITTPFIGTFIGSQTFDLRASAKDKILKTSCTN